MKWNRIICLLIVSVLLTGGLAVMGSEPTKAEGLPETIQVGVELSQETGLRQAAQGDLDIFMQSTGGQTFAQMSDEIQNELGTWSSSGSYTNFYLNPAHEGDGTDPMQNALDNGWVDSPDDVNYTLNNHDGNWEFNPFSMDKVRYAMNFLVDRESQIQDLADGFGQPRYIWLNAATGGYKDNLESLVEDGDPGVPGLGGDADGHGLSPSGDQEFAANLVEAAMNEAMGNVSIGEIRGPEPSPTGFWQYKPPNGEYSDIMLDGWHREEDWRKDVGAAFATKLKKHCDINVNPMIRTKAEAIPTVFYGEYDQAVWHYYTGGWGASANVYYPDLSLAQMYAPWYGFMPTYNSEGHWSYANDPDGQRLNELTLPLNNGQVNNMTQYWDMTREAVDLALKESVRVFLVTETNFYAYDKDTINNVVTNAVTGWDQVFGPKTLDTTQDKIKLDYFSAQEALYMDNWNWYGGSTGAYGANQRRFLLDFGSWNHPQTGKAMEVRCQWSGDGNQGDVKTDYKWVENETGAMVLNKNVSVPSDAVIYNDATETWEDVGSGVKSAMMVTYDVVEGKWHDGEDFTVSDIMEYYARTKDMVYENPDKPNDYYYGAYASQMKPTFESIKGTQWNAEEGTFTIWGDYTFPSDSNMASYYSFFPRNPQPMYEAVLQEVVDTDLSTSTESWSWESGVADNWVHLLSPDHGQVFTQTMQKMKEENWRPPYVKDANNAPIVVSQDEYETRLTKIQDFFDEHDHLFISQGPYYLDDLTLELNEMTWKKFDNYTEAYSWDYWPNQFETKTINLPELDHNGPVKQGEDLTVTATAYVQEKYPTEQSVPVKREMNLDPFELVIKQEGETVHTVPGEDITITPGESQSTLEATIPTDDLSPGSYSVVLTIGIPGAREDATNDASLIIEEGQQPGVEWSVSNFGVSPTEGEAPLTVDITATVENTGTSSGELVLMAGGNEVNSWTVDPGQTINIDESHEFTSKGDYDIKLDGPGDTKTVTVTEEDDGDGTPGFTLGLLAIGAVIAVAIYQKKRR